MKKYIPLLVTAGYFLAATSAYAISIQPPTNIGISGGTAPSTIISSAIRIVYSVAILLVLVFLILGAFNWITSGGDKEKVGKARGMILNSIIGLAILALAWVLVTVLGAILHINVLDNFAINDLQGGTTNI